MQNIKFKKTLFGFKRSQVIEYITQAESDFESENKALSDKLSSTEGEIAAYAAKADEAQKNAAAARAEAEYEKRKRLEAEKESASRTAEANEECLMRMIAESELKDAKDENERHESELAERDNIIIKLKNDIQEQNVATTAIRMKLIKAQEKISQNEQAYIKSRSMLTGYLDVLHKENIELTERNAQLSVDKEITEPPVKHNASAEEILDAIREGISKITTELKPFDESDGSSARSLKIL